jgi:hypothetical protein
MAMATVAQTVDELDGLLKDSNNKIEFEVAENISEEVEQAMIQVMHRDGLERSIEKYLKVPNPAGGKFFYAF